MAQEPLDFVINNGKYWSGVTFGEYVPDIAVSDPLPQAALLEWAFQHDDVSPEWYRLIRGIQDYTAPNMNSWGIKNRDGELAYTVYFNLFPIRQTEMSGRDRPEMRIDNNQGNLNYFTRFEHEHFGAPVVEHDQFNLGLDGMLWEMSFDPEESVFRDKKITEYTLSVHCGPFPSLPVRPVQWKSYAWDKGDRVRAEQYGIVVNPFEHEQELTQFLEKAIRAQWPEKTDVRPSDLLMPSLMQKNMEKHRLFLAHKTLKTGIAFYYVGIDYPTWVGFLKDFHYPASFVQKATENRARLEHMVFDVAVMHEEVDGAVIPARTALYGTF